MAILPDRHNGHFCPNFRNGHFAELPKNGHLTYYPKWPFSRINQKNLILPNTQNRNEKKIFL